MSTINALTGNMGDFSGIVLKAAARGDEAAVLHYLEINPDWLNQGGPHGRTLLWEAAYKGRTKLVAKLIELGAEVNCLGSYYTPMLVELSPLAVTRAAENEELTDLLLKHGATDDLYSATYRGDLEAMKQFLQDDPESVNRPARDAEPHPRMGYHPIHYAVVGHQLAAARFLVGYEAEIDEHLPLLIDWAQGDREIIRFLKEKASNRGKKKLNEARKPKPEFADVPAIDRPDEMGFPALVEACRGNHNAPDDPQRVKKLLDLGANINIQDHKEKTPLHRAAQAGFQKIIPLLLKHGADTEIADAKGATPIFDAAQHGRNEVVKILAKHGANLEHTESRGETPLFTAARGHHDYTFALLLELGAKADHINNKGQTVANMIGKGRQVSEGRLRILKLLNE